MRIGGVLNSRSGSEDVGIVAIAEDVGGISSGAGGDFARLSPQIRNPLLNVVNFYLPQDRKVLNQWIRYYCIFHPIVGNSLDLHSEVVVSPFDLDGIDDQMVMNVYKEMCFDHLDLFNKSIEITKEVYAIGEAFPFTQWNETKGIFDQLVIFDPDYVHLHPTPFVHVKGGTMFEVEPSEQLRDFVNSTDPIDVKLQSQLDPAIRHAVQSGGMIRVSPFNMTALMKKAFPYDVRGTSIVLRVLKYLMYEDKLIEAQYKIADGHVAPRWIFKLGDQQRGKPPTKAALKSFRDKLMEGWYDANFAIVSSYALQVEAIGSAGKIMPILPEMQYIEDRILTGLFTSKAATTGVGPTYQNSSIARLWANTRYFNRRRMLEQWYEKKLFEPVAKAHQFYEPLTEAEQKHGIRKGERKLMIPKVNWLHKLDLTDTTDFRQYLMKMRDTLGISMKTVCRVFGIDYAEEEKNLLRERGSIFDPVYQDYRKKHAAAMFDKKEGKGALELPGGEVGGELPAGLEGAGGPGGGEEAAATEEIAGGGITE